MEKLNQSTLEKAMRRAFKIWLGVIPAPECLEDMQTFRIPAVDVAELRLGAANGSKTLDCPSDVCDYLAELVVTDYDWHMLPCSVRRILLDMVVWAAANTLDLAVGTASDAMEAEEEKHHTLSAILASCPRR
nr:MAG TPA: hypothetical protein [Caudoviricetes sp.]